MSTNIRHLFVILTIGLAAFSATANTSDFIQHLTDSSQRMAALLPSGIPLVAFMNCSAAAVQSPSFGASPRIITARHCFFSRPNDGTYHFQSAGFSAGSVMGVFNPFKQSFTFELGDAETRNVQDLVIASPQGPLHQLRVLPMAESFPSENENIHLWGYPAKGIPLVATVSGMSRFDCTYKGFFISPQAAKGARGAYSIFHLAECPRQSYIQGMSGGPVTNELGEYIGTTSMAVDSDVQFSGPSKDKSYVIFSGLTEQELALRKKVSDDLHILTKEKFTSRIEGVRHFDRVKVLSVKAESLPDGRVQKVGQILEGYFDVPFLNDAIHGELQVYDSAHNLLFKEIYNHGFFMGRK